MGEEQVRGLMTLAVEEGRRQRRLHRMRALFLVTLGMDVLLHVVLSVYAFSSLDEDFFETRAKLGIVVETLIAVVVIGMILTDHAEGAFVFLFARLLSAIGLAGFAIGGGVAAEKAVIACVVAAWYVVACLASTAFILSAMKAR